MESCSYKNNSYKLASSKLYGRLARQILRIQPALACSHSWLHYWLFQWLDLLDKQMSVEKFARWFALQQWQWEERVRLLRRTPLASASRPSSQPCGKEHRESAGGCSRSLVKYYFRIPQTIGLDQYCSFCHCLDFNIHSESSERTIFSQTLSSMTTSLMLGEHSMHQSHDTPLANDPPVPKNYLKQRYDFNYRMRQKKLWVQADIFNSRVCIWVISHIW